MAGVITVYPGGNYEKHLRGEVGEIIIGKVREISRYKI